MGYTIQSFTLTFVQNSKLVVSPTITVFIFTFVELISILVPLHQTHHSAVPEFSRKSWLTKCFSGEPVARRHLLPALRMSGLPIVKKKMCV